MRYKKTKIILIGGMFLVSLAMVADGVYSSFSRELAPGSFLLLCVLLCGYRCFLAAPLLQYLHRRREERKREKTQREEENRLQKEQEEMRQTPSETDCNSRPDSEDTTAKRLSSSRRCQVTFLGIACLFFFVAGAGVAWVVVSFHTQPKMANKSGWLKQTIKTAVRFAEPRIDTTTLETYAKSLENMKKSLSPKENERLDEALRYLRFGEANDYGMLGELLAQLADSPELQANLFSQIDGKTAEEIVDLASQRVDEKILSLERDRQEADKTGTLLEAQLPISDARFYWSKDPYSYPVVELKITNDTGVAITRVLFHGTVSAPGRTIPWIDEDFQEAISGGLENGESKLLRIMQTSSGPWGNTDAKKTSEKNIKITVLNAKDAEGGDLAAEKWSAFERTIAGDPLAELRGVKEILDADHE